MAKTLGEQLLAMTVQRSRQAVHPTHCSVCGELLSNNTAKGDRQVVRGSDTSHMLVFGLTVLLGLPMLCGGLYLFATTLLNTPNSGSNAAIANRCNAPVR